MINAEQYYNNTQRDNPSKLLMKIINKNIQPGKAIDLGCGAGNDTVYLIKNGWKVIAIDSNDVSDRIKNRLNDDELLKFKFQKQIFEELHLSNCNLIVAQNSLSFCNPQNFDKMWKEITQNIQKGGYFVGNFFGIKDEWNTIQNNKNMTFLSIEQVKKLFKQFEIIILNERCKEGKTGLGQIKLWHIFYVIARKK